MSAVAIYTHQCKRWYSHKSLMGRIYVKTHNESGGGGGGGGGYIMVRIYWR